MCLIASSRYPVREPFAGGLEALTHQLARQLAARGHEVSLFAAAGSDPELPVTLIDAGTFEPSAAAQRDVNAPAASWMAEHHAYLMLMLDLARDGAGRFDLVHNHSLHHLPVAMAPMLQIPLLTTLHTRRCRGWSRRSRPPRAPRRSPPSAGVRPRRGRTWSPATPC